MGLVRKAKKIKAAATTREGRLGMAAGALTAAVGTVVPGVGLAAPVVAGKVSGWAKDNPEVLDAVGDKVSEGVDAIKGRFSHFKDGLGQNNDQEVEEPEQ
jgi:hypothetical protein